MEKMSFNEYKAFVYELLEHMKDTDTDKVELEYEGAKIKLVKKSHVAPTAVCTESAPQSAILRETASNETARPVFKAVKSPLVGIAYRAASPEAAPFVEAGTEIKKGDVICIIEAMKVMNEIESDCDGIVEEILFENGDAVEFGQPLIRLK